MPRVRRAHRDRRGVAGSNAEAASNDWITAYEVDFTSLSTLNLLTGGDGSKTIDGKSWTATNTTNAAAASGGILGITNGTGLQIKASTNSANWNTNTRTAPLITVPFANLATFPTSSHDVRVMIHFSYSPTQNYQYLFLATELSSPVATTRRMIARAYNSFSGISGNQIFNSEIVTATTTLAGQATTATNENVMGFELYGREGASIRGMKPFFGTYSSGWPGSPTSMDQLLGFVGNSGSGLYTTSNTNLTIAASGAAANAQVTATILKLKVEYRNGTPITLG